MQRPVRTLESPVAASLEERERGKARACMCSPRDGLFFGDVCMSVALPMASSECPRQSSRYNVFAWIEPGKCICFGSKISTCAPVCLLPTPNVRCDSALNPRPYTGLTCAGGHDPAGGVQLARGARRGGGRAEAGGCGRARVCARPARQPRRARAGGRRARTPLPGRRALTLNPLFKPNDVSGHRGLRVSSLTEASFPLCIRNGYLIAG